MERTFETPGPVRLWVENAVGLVSITATETDTTTVELEAATPGGLELVDRAAVECRSTGQGMVVVVKIPKAHGMKFVRRNAVIARITVPTDSRLDIATGSADVDVTGRIGAAEFKTASGDVTAADVADRVVAKTASGHVTVGAIGGSVQMKSASGDLRCSMVGGRTECMSTSGDVEIGSALDRVEVRATSGRVRLGDVSGDVRIVNVSGDVRVLALSEGGLEVRSVSGNVSVGITAGVGLHVDVETMSGAIRSDIALHDVPTKGGGSQVDLSVRSVSGNVDIARALEQVA